MSSKPAAAAAPRIYYLTEEFYPPQIGGVELMVSYLSHGLAARGISTQVITRQPSPPVLPEETIGRVRVRRIRPGGQMKGIGWRALPAVLSYLWRLAFILLSESGRYDVVIVSGRRSFHWPQSLSAGCWASAASSASNPLSSSPSRSRLRACARWAMRDGYCMESSRMSNAMC